MTRKFSQMQTEEQRYGATRLAADLRQRADQQEKRANASAKKLLSEAWGRTVSEEEFAPSRRQRAEAKRLREQAAQLEADAQPKKKRRWF